jgi:hypothetical protein
MRGIEHPVNIKLKGMFIEFGCLSVTYTIINTQWIGDAVDYEVGRVDCRLWNTLNSVKGIPTEAWSYPYLMGFEQVPPQVTNMQELDYR